MGAVMAIRMKLESIHREGNVRLDLGDLTGLAESIRQHGVKVPIQVYVLGEDAYGLLDGDRRLAAAEIAGLEDIPVEVVPAPIGSEKVILQLVVNTQRQDLNPIDRAHGYAKLVEMGCTQKDIAGWMGISDSQVSQRMALLGLVDELKEAVQNGKLFARAAYYLAQLEPDQQRSLAKSAIAARSVRRVERMVRMAQAMGLSTEDEPDEPESVPDGDPLRLLALEDAKAVKHHLEAIKGALPLDEGIGSQLETILFEIEALLKEVWRLM